MPWAVAASFDPRSPLDEFLLSLSPAAHPRVCFVPTPTGDRDPVIAAFFEAFAGRDCKPSCLRLFGTPKRPAEQLADQDVIYVSGGNTANALALWRLHGVDRALREAWERGAVLGGVSAGANCWFEASVTDSFGPQLDPIRDGLGFLPGQLLPPLSTATSGGGRCTRARRRTASRRDTRRTTAQRSTSSERSCGRLWRHSLGPGRTESSPASRRRSSPGSFETRRSRHFRERQRRNDFWTRAAAPRTPDAEPRHPTGRALSREPRVLRNTSEPRLAARLHAPPLARPRGVIRRASRATPRAPAHSGGDRALSKRSVRVPASDRLHA